MASNLHFRGSSIMPSFEAVDSVTLVIDGLIVQRGFVLGCN